jgi:ubiquinone/menaquinone biosynthesis C-methylase UbiE
MKQVVSPIFINSLKDLSFAERHLEPESMEETVEEYAAMDFRSTNNAFVEFISPLIPSGARVADMGCGPGDITILLAQKRPDLKIIGVDLAPSMLDFAASSARELGAGCVEWKLGNITKSVFAAGELDFVYSHTTLHHLPDLRPFFIEMTRALKPRGGFALRDLRRPATSEIALQWIKEAAGESLSQRQFELFFYSLRAGLTLEEIQTLAGELKVDGVLEATRNPDRYWLFYRPIR